MSCVPIRLASGALTKTVSRKVITCYERPPIEERWMDWSATLDNCDGANSPTGHGATERDAVSNLLDLLSDEDWAQVWQGWIERI